ncbi:acyltransferase [Nakamurella silvestris]|nr:acyltransferase [Nakamurella silvestris]
MYLINIAARKSSAGVPASERSSTKSLALVFDPRLNALNALRLALAVGVIFFHSFPLTGTPLRWWPAAQFLGNAFVDGFFALSGFLILSSWVRNPQWWAFLRARLLRILPAFYVCLAFTAFVAAPLAVVIRGEGMPPGFPESIESFVKNNALLEMRQFDIAGTPADVPFAQAWNGSLWTLYWEFKCYLAVLVLGVLGCLKWRLTVPMIFLLTLAGSITARIAHIDSILVNNTLRFALMFSAGAVVYVFRHRIPANWGLVAVAAVVIGWSTTAGDYRFYAALPLAYLLIVAGSLIKVPRLRLKNDLSYGMYIYAFPMQQLLATVGLASWGAVGFGIVSTLATVPLAAASWFLIERRALRYKTTRTAPTPNDPAAEPAPS